MPIQMNHFTTFLERGGDAEGGARCWEVSEAMEVKVFYCRKATKSFLLLE